MILCTSKASDVDRLGIFFIDVFDDDILTFKALVLFLALSILSILAISLNLFSSCFRSIYFSNPICLYKQGLIDLSLILQAVKCHAASNTR
jgi:uncharacterized membrane protein YcaP (DUF421 family)